MTCCSRRNFIAFIGSSCLASPLLANEKISQSIYVLNSKNLPYDERKKHESFMKKAIEQGAKNPKYPFGSVIADFESGKILGEGVNSGADNPTFHGEIAAINNYVQKHGNQGWGKLTLYTTGEPCSMCMSAIAWAGIPRVVWASSIHTIRASGIGQIDIPAAEVAARAKEFYHPQALIEGILSDQTDLIFSKRKR